MGEAIATGTATLRGGASKTTMTTTKMTTTRVDGDHHDNVNNAALMTATTERIPLPLPPPPP